MFSCKTRNLFENAKEGDILDLIVVKKDYEQIIVPDNKVSISIWNHENMSVGSAFSIYNSNKESGKWLLVDAAGRVKLPELGEVQLAGLTSSQAADTLTTLYKDILQDPVVIVKVLNRRVSVLGEVKSPGTFVLEEERNSVTQLISIAGGFDDYANLEKIQLLRDSTLYTINLTVHSEQLLHSIVIKADDIINVPSRKGKMLDKRAATLIPFATAASAIVLVITLIVK